jgi:hypothetical protein
MLTATMLGTLIVAAAAQGVASAQTREVAVRTLGGPNRFSVPMQSADELKAMINANRAQVTSALGQAGLGDISDKFLDTVNSDYISDTTISPGTHFDWMALKRAGSADLLRNVRWTGRDVFDAFQFSVEYNGYNYTFIVPKICGNFALLSRTAVVAAAPPPAVFLGSNTTTIALDTVNTTQSKFAYNLGAGFFGYVNRWGIRADIRNYRASTFEDAKLENGPTPAIDFTQSLLSGLRYWRANLGIAYRW